MRAVIPVAVALLLAAFLPPAASADSGQERTWNFVQATIPGAQDRGYWGEGVTVAVVDTWVDFQHPDLKGRIAGHAVCINSANGCHDNSYDRDRCIHGTHVAGTVVSGRYGVAPRASVLAVQVLSYQQDATGGSCSGTTEDVARAIRFAVGKGVEVINLSLGSEVPGLFRSEAIEGAVADAARAGVVVVFAAGNRTVPISDNYGSNALIVAATGPDGNITSYSSRGNSVSLAAPGGDDGAAGLSACTRQDCILSTVPGNGYDVLEGTSMAAPHVSGVAALLLSQVPGRGREDVMTSMQSTARPVAGASDGLIDATAALRLRNGTRPTATSTTAQNSEPVVGNRQRTRQPRPSAEQPEAPAASDGPDAGAGSSRSVTFPRRDVDRPAAGDEESRQAADVPAPPGDDGPGPTSDDSSGLPLMVVWGGLAAAGALGALWSVLGRRRLFGNHQ